MQFKLEQIDIPLFRKLQNIENLKIGKKITLISGINGVGKSNILSLIASGSGMNKTRYTGGKFHPDFSEYFKIEENELDNDYRVYLKYRETQTKYSFSKRISFKNDMKGNRGIRTIPRTTNTPSDNQLKQEVKLKLGIGESARVPIPTVFISLSRLFPLGESDITLIKVSENTKLIKNRANEKYKEWYNAVLPNSIESEETSTSKLTKTATHRNSLYMQIDQATARTQSIGQDNLGNIISALVDFYLLSLEDSYQGGIICIDEIEASLHPSAQIKLLDLFKVLSDELDLQIILSSHSLTFIKEIITLNNTNPDDFELIYFKDILNPVATTYKTYQSLKADLFDEQNIIKPKVKIYCEDGDTRRLFNLLIQTAYNLDKFKKYQTIPEWEIVPVSVGCNNLFNLPEQDEYFTQVGILLDGDARCNKVVKISEYINNPTRFKGYSTKPHSKTIIFLPNFLPPESFLYFIIQEYTKNNNVEYNDFWRTTINNPDTFNYTSARVRDTIVSISPIDNADLKKNNIPDKMFSFCESTRILTHHYSLHPEELDMFIDDFLEMLNILQKKIKSQRY